MAGTSELVGVHGAPGQGATLAIFARLRARLLRMPPGELARWQAGLAGAPPAFRALAEEIGGQFLAGYGEAIVASDLDRLASRLERAPARFRGFAFEGAGLGLAVRDAFGRGGLVEAFATGPGAAHAYVVYVGAGWALARIPVLGGRGLRGGDPLERWFAYDGWGFHEAYSCRRAVFERHKRPRRLPFEARSAFDEGVGRCAWFQTRGDVDALTALVRAFPPDRRPDFWSGVGLACGYAGGGDEAVAERLVGLEPALQPAFGQGLAFASEAHRRAGHPFGELDVLCRRVTGHDANRLAELVLATRPDPMQTAAKSRAGARRPQDPARPPGLAFPEWQRRLREALVRAG